MSALPYSEAFEPLPAYQRPSRAFVIFCQVARSFTPSNRFLTAKYRGADTFAFEFEAALFVFVANAPAFVPLLALRCKDKPFKYIYPKPAKKSQKSTRLTASSETRRTAFPKLSIQNFKERSFPLSVFRFRFKPTSPDPHRKSRGERTHAQANSRPHRSYA